MNDIKDIIEKEVIIKAARSGGKGGQYVNKVSTKIIIKFNILNSSAFSDYQKNIIINKLGNKLTKEGDLVISSGNERSQYLNKKRCMEKLYSLISNALKVGKKRIKTMPTEESKEKRIREKKIISEKKLLRSKKIIE